jgi:hypothetical protein
MADANSPASSRLFISYRREDSSGHVLALLPALRKHFGADRIFKDTDNIPPGADFLKFIKRELESCSVLLAIIGRDWLTVQDPRLGHRRLDNPEDFLRVEVASALKNERVRVIPVLVERASMPAAEDLPPDLAELRYRNAIELSDARWESDVQLLIEAVEQACADSAAKPQAASQRPELVDLHKRRAREIAAHLTGAREALEARDYEGALWACEKALVLDPQLSEALELLDRARRATDEQSIDTALEQARQALSRRNIGEASDYIDQALAIDSTSQAALTLRKEMLALRRERERERERARVVQAATERAQASLEEEDFEAAVRHADDALAVEPAAAEPLSIRLKALAALDERRRQREHKRGARQAVAPMATQEARREADARVVEAPGRAEAVAAALDEAKQSLDRGDFESAIRQADAALALEPAHSSALALRDDARTALVQGQAREEHEVLARQAVERARSTFDAGEHRAAIDLLDEFRPPHALVSGALDRLRGQLRSIEQRRGEQEEEAARRGLDRDRPALGRRRADAFRAANRQARTILTSATRELPAAVREFWSTRRDRVFAAALVIIIAAIGIYQYGQTSAPSSQPDAPPISGDPVPPPASDERIEAPTPPPDRSPAPEPTAPPVTSPVTSPTKEEETELRLERFRKTALDQQGKGQRVQALNTAAAGLQLAPEDPVLRSVVDRLLSQAQSSAQRANTRASNAGAATLARKTFSEAVALEDEARRSKTKLTAIQSFWNAEGRFDLAAQQAANEQARLKEADAARKKEVDDQHKKIPAEPPPAVNRVEQEKARIEATLRRYEYAYDNLDAEAVKAVYSGAPGNLALTFAGYEFYRLEMVVERIDVSADATSAKATCRLSHYFKPKGAKEEQQKTRPEFTLHKRGENWVIVQQRF